MRTISSKEPAESDLPWRQSSKSFHHGGHGGAMGAEAWRPPAAAGVVREQRANESACREIGSQLASRIRFRVALPRRWRGVAGPPGLGRLSRVSGRTIFPMDLHVPHGEIRRTNARVVAYLRFNPNARSLLWRLVRSVPSSLAAPETFQSVWSSAWRMRSRSAVSRTPCSPVVVLAA